MTDLKSIARKYAVKNAHDYGSARAEPIIGRLLAITKGADPAGARAAASDAVAWANALDRDSLEKEYSAYEKEFAAEQESKEAETAKPKLVLEGAAHGKVITRISPEPSGYMHVGHVKQALLSAESARLYSGKIYRYFDDTNPEKCKQEYVDAMKKDHEWLGMKFDREYYASDQIGFIYECAEKLIGLGKAYVCTCAREQMQQMRYDGISCEHRSQSVVVNKELFAKMLNGGFSDGEATLRFMGDMKAANTTLRDPVIARIVTAPHYKQGTKYRVWPLYDFNTPVLDSANGVTDIIRSKEYELRDELDKRILEALDMRVPRMHLEARLNVKGNETHKREIRKLIEDGKISGWDDPRLMTIMALRRRGIRPEAIREFVMRFGFSKTDSEVPLEMLLAENKSIIDKSAKHLFFVPEPIMMEVHGWNGADAKLRLHPSADIGFREYKTSGKFYIPKDDASLINIGGILRLKDLSDVKIIASSNTIIAERIEDGAKGRIVQWVDANNPIKCEVVIPGEILDDRGEFNPDSIRTVHGVVEPYAASLKKGEIVQFERFGYCILDDKDSMRFIFTSK